MKFAKLDKTATDETQKGTTGPEEEEKDETGVEYDESITMKEKEGRERQSESVRETEREGPQRH